MDCIRKSLRTASAEEEPIIFAGLEVVNTFTKPKKVHYSEDSDCGLYSDGSDDTDGEYDPHEGMRNSSAKLIEESEEDIYEDLPDLVTDSLDTDTDDTGYDEKRHSSNMKITDMITDMNNTELENFMQAATELASSDSPIEELKPLPQWFQEGYVCEIKTPKGSMHVGDAVIYSEDPSGTSLTYLEDDSGRHSKASQDTSEPMIKYDSTWYQKAASREPWRGYQRAR